jgi:hypothetical protein
MPRWPDLTVEERFMQKVEKHKRLTYKTLIH